MKLFTHKLIAVIIVCSSLSPSAFAEFTAKPAINKFICMVFTKKTHGDGFDMTKQVEFTWDNQKEVSEIVYEEGKLIYALASQPKTGVMSMSILDSETRGMSSAAGDLNRVMLIYDSAKNSLFGCSSVAQDIESLANATNLR